MRQRVSQRFVFKIHSKRLRNNKWDLKLSVKDARANGEIISLADSQMLRWIDELNEVSGADIRAQRIKNEIYRIKHDPGYPDAKKRLKFLYDELDRVEFKADYISVVMDSKTDYRRACRGFKVNGVGFVRLLGTPGGIKTSTIVFVSERLAPELRRRIDNGRDMTKTFVPAKLEAYRALTCSGSTPVSMPNGVAVISERELHFTEPAIRLRDGEDGGEPVMEFDSEADIALNMCDGCGMMLPSLAKRWSDELELGYTSCGFNTRFSWEKGMVVTFDFLEFAEKVAHKYTFTDVWGNEVDVRNVELVLSASMVKLWNSYSSCDEYMRNCVENHYTFNITKTCPEKLDNERRMNYQFIQSYELSDDDLDELLAPTIRELHDITSDDPMMSVLFMKGTHINERNVMALEDDAMKGVMIDPDLYRDPYVRSKIRNAVQGGITDAKIGRIKVHGNFSIIVGDLYALCEHMFDMPIHGILRAGELYSQYWIGSDKVVCFRAPMSCHNNIRTQSVSTGEDVLYWFRYLTTATVFNVHDSLTHALNGADFDGDLVFITDNPVLVRRTRNLPVIMCEQGNAPKVIPDENDFIVSNIRGFGDDIGKITNRITAMFDVQSQYEPGSEEYETLAYRIQAGQKLQQDSIDRIKGIISNPMPRTWYSRMDVHKMPEDTAEQRHVKDLYLRIVADRKPYFQRYIYPTVMRAYKTYINDTNGNCISRFKMFPDELMKEEELSDEQAEFLKWYWIKMPVGAHDCVMNRICRIVESETAPKPDWSVPYDYSKLSTGGVPTVSIRNAVSDASNEYGSALTKMAMFFQNGADEKIFEDKVSLKRFIEEAMLLKCQNIDIACDAAISMCAKKRSNVGFLWDLFGDILIDRLLAMDGMTMRFPIRDDNGTIEYCGEKYSVATIILDGESNRHYTEREGLCGTFDDDEDVWGQADDGSVHSSSIVLC